MTIAMPSPSFGGAGVEGVGRVVGGDTGNVPEGTLVVLAGLPSDGRLPCRSGGKGARTPARGPHGAGFRERLLAVMDGVEPTLASSLSEGRVLDTLQTRLQPDRPSSPTGTSGEPCVIDAHNVVFRQILLSGFWLPRARTTTPPQVVQEISVRALALHPGLLLFQSPSNTGL